MTRPSVHPPTQLSALGARKSPACATNFYNSASNASLSSSAQLAHRRALNRSLPKSRIVRRSVVVIAIPSPRMALTCTWMAFLCRLIDYQRLRNRNGLRQARDTCELGGSEEMFRMEKDPMKWDGKVYRQVTFGDDGSIKGTDKEAETRMRRRSGICGSIRDSGWLRLYGEFFGP